MNAHSSDIPTGKTGQCGEAGNKCPSTGKWMYKTYSSHILLSKNKKEPLIPVKNTGKTPKHAQLKKPEKKEFIFYNSII